MACMGLQVSWKKMEYMQPHTGEGEVKLGEERLTKVKLYKYIWEQ